MKKQDRKRLPPAEPTPEQVYWNRRRFLKMLGLGAVAASGTVFLGRQIHSASAGLGAGPESRKIILRPGVERPTVLEQFPVPRNHAFDQLPGGAEALTDELVAATHNNFYEFFPNRAGEVWRFCNDFAPDPWKIEVSGRCHKPQTFDIDDAFTKFGGLMEERTYRFRCVEAWAMDVPWTGFELGKILEAVEPAGDAKFVRFVSAADPESMSGMNRTPHYPWPYFEALRMDEAMNPLTLLATGIYGRPLPRQHGAPFRVIVPWKYGYKSAKSIVKIELTTTQPPTFWNTVSPREYSFLSNIEPQVPHPRWSQRREQVLGTGQSRPTLLYGGYGEFVAKLYT